MSYDENKKTREQKYESVRKDIKSTSSEDTKVSKKDDSKKNYTTTTTIMLNNNSGVTTESIDRKDEETNYKAKNAPIFDKYKRRKILFNILYVVLVLAVLAGVIWFIVYMINK